MFFGLIQRVKGVEEFLLCRIFTGDKLDIVDQQDIGLAVALAELGRGTVADGLDHFIGKLVALWYK